MEVEACWSFVKFTERGGLMTIQSEGSVSFSRSPRHYECGQTYASNTFLLVERAGDAAASGAVSFYRGQGSAAGVTSGGPFFPHLQLPKDFAADIGKGKQYQAERFSRRSYYGGRAATRRRAAPH